MSMQAKKHENIPKNAKETTTERILSIKMSTKGAQVFTFSLPGGRLVPCPPVSYATASGHPVPIILQGQSLLEPIQTLKSPLFMH